MFELQRWNNIGGMLAEAEGKLLYEEVMALPGGSIIVEIGCYEGRSTVAMLQACRDSMQDKPFKKLITIDNFSGSGMEPGVSTQASRDNGVRVVTDNVANFNLLSWFGGVRPMTSEEWFNQSSDFVADMFFIDGYHPGVQYDMHEAWKRLRPGGVIICHDYHTTDPGLFWLRDLIDQAGLPGRHMAVGTSFYKAVKPR
jgi:hypothetical protein